LNRARGGENFFRKRGRKKGRKRKRKRGRILENVYI